MKFVSFFSVVSKIIVHSYVQMTLLRADMRTSCYIHVYEKELLLLILKHLLKLRFEYHSLYIHFPQLSKLYIILTACEHVNRKAEQQKGKFVVTTYWIFYIGI